MGGDAEIEGKDPGKHGEPTSQDAGAGAGGGGCRAPLGAHTVSPAARVRPRCHQQSKVLLRLYFSSSFPREASLFKSQLIPPEHLHEKLFNYLLATPRWRVALLGLLITQPPASPREPSLAAQEVLQEPIPRPRAHFRCRWLQGGEWGSGSRP